jgi:predicted ATPase/DNA-binding CsgD family transcriptional regulator
VTGPGNLPGQLTRFIGRETTVELVSRRLNDDRVVTLVGPGGCGKTRLAIEVGGRVAHLRPHGVFFVDLSGLADPGLMPGAVLHVLGLRAAPGHDPIEVLVTQVAKRELLVILDNCEHMLELCARVADSLARAASSVWVLATSRERLGVSGEVIVPIEGLELPDRVGGAGQEWLEGSEAGRLFIDRATRARPGFAVDDAAATDVARICERLDGIPLAIEMAAARARLMSTHAIADGLSDRFRLLVGNERVVPSRHRTLLASIEWSCGLLSEEERTLLSGLSVFAPGFTLAAVEAVCSTNEIAPEHVLRLLTSLVDKCLVQADADSDRFRLHETMRAFAGVALEAGGATVATRDRHLRYFTDLAKTMPPDGYAIENVGAFARDLDNLRAALDWAVESRNLDVAADLFAPLGAQFVVLGLWAEGLARCERLLATELKLSHRAAILDRAALYARNSDPAATLTLGGELAALGRSLGDNRVIVLGLHHIANVKAWAEPDEAVRISEEAISLVRGEDKFPLVSGILHDNSWAYFWLGRPSEALAAAEEALRAVQEVGSLWGEVIVRTNTSIAQTYLGRPARALEEADLLIEDSMALSCPRMACWGFRHRGEALMYLNDARAEDAFGKARAIAESIDDPFNLACAETCQGQLQVSLGHDDEGCKLLEAGISKLEDLGFARMCTRDRAVLAEVALRRGDLEGARSHLSASARRLPRKPGPEGVPVLRAEARLARAENCPRRAHGLACDGAEAAVGSGQRLWALDLLELVAISAADLGRFNEAARLLGAAEAQREATGYARWAPAREELAPVLATIEAGLGPEAFNEARSEGRVLSLDGAVAYANRGRGSHSRAASGWESLTPAERRVVGLVAEHLTNAEIADKLFVSTATVKSHLTRVFDKLGVADRGQLTAVAATHLASAPT